MNLQVESPARFAALKLRSGISENDDEIRHLENRKTDEDAHWRITGNGASDRGMVMVIHTRVPQFERYYDLVCHNRALEFGSR